MLKAAPLGTKRLATVLLVLVVVAWSGVYVALQNENSSALVDARTKASQISINFAAHVENTFRYADDYLKTVRDIYERSNGDLEAVKRYMHLVPPNTYILSHITIIDKDGRPRLLSNGITERPIKPGVHTRDRDYFISQKDSPEDSLFLSKAIKGRNTGLLTVRLVRRTVSPNGDFNGVIFAAIKADQIMRYYENTRMGTNSTASIVGTSDKMIRLRMRGTEIDGIGRDVSKSDLWKQLKVTPYGIYERISIIDGIDRYWAYTALEEYPFIVVIGAAKKDALLTKERTRGLLYLIALAITLIAFILVLLARRAIANASLVTEIETRQQSEQALRDAMAEARAANAAKAEFMTSISRELLTPVDAMIEDIKSLATVQKVPRRADQQETIIKIRDSGVQLGELMKQVLDLSRIQAGALQLKPQTLSVADMVQEAASKMQDTAMAQKIELFCDTDELLFIRADRARMREILQNLLSNAVKYSQEGDTVKIAAGEQANGYIRICVIDTGMGIPDDLHSRVFQPFSRLGQEHSDIDGTGIGLALARQLTELMGGTIGFTSVEGEGSEFWVEFPQA